jgi:hypothetical protein
LDFHNFGSQEPGTNEEIAFANKIMVLRSNDGQRKYMCAMYQFLTQKIKMD